MKKYAKKKCPHDRIQFQCKKCGGKGICEHNIVRSACKECGGSQICEHDRVRSSCKECGGFLTMARMMRANIKHRAKKNGIPFDISVQDLLELIGDGTCPVLGIPYDLTRCKPGSGDSSATLDKFIPELGYIKGNCFVMSRIANTVKNNATAEQVRRVANWMEQQEKKNQEKKNQEKKNQSS